MNFPSPARANPHVQVSELVNRRWLSPKTFEIELRKPSSFQFLPGQRITLMHNTLERDYTPVSSPSDPTITLCIRKLEEGVISPLLASAEMGTQIHFTGPYGYFTFRASPRSAVFVATGTGIAPFVSMGRSGIGGFILLHGVRTPHELYYESLFHTKARRYVPCLSGVPLRSSAPPGTFYGKVTGYMKEHLPKGSYDFYLCGRGDMIRDVTLLVDERFSGSFIYAEIFY